MQSILAHIRKVWNERFPDNPLEQQDVVITLPASFDEVARELTVAAARIAGLPNILLIEEPQAAFYAWLASHQESWEQKIRAGQTVLICDIGGGTTDFTLIRVKATANSVNTEGLEQKYGLHRVAVGDHLLLGGDNLDAALPLMWNSWQVHNHKKSYPRECGMRYALTAERQKKHC